MEEYLQQLAEAKKATRNTVAAEVPAMWRPLHETLHTGALFCTLSRPGVDTLRSAVAEGDPAAFLVIGHGQRATGGVVRGGNVRTRP